MIELDHEGNFVGFFGAVKTQPDLWKILWRFFATEEQKKRTPLVIPTEYSSNDIDDKGFVYGTVGIIDPKDFSDTMFIHRLNPIGDDILRRYGSVAPMGDAEYTIDKETNLFLPSMLTDICVQDSGIYTVLDRRLGRVFTYDFNGQLLYVFGALGHSLGQFKRRQPSIPSTTALPFWTVSLPKSLFSSRQSTADLSQARSNPPTPGSTTPPVRTGCKP